MPNELTYLIIEAMQQAASKNSGNTPEGIWIVVLLLFMVLLASNSYLLFGYHKWMTNLYDEYLSKKR